MEEDGNSSMPSEAVCVKQEPENVFNEQVHVKEEAEYTKKEAEERVDSVAFNGVSGAALAELYAGHEVKDELVLGPVGPQPPDIVFTLRAAQALDVREQPVLKDCVVRLERVDDHEALVCTNTCWVTGGRAASLTKHVEHHSDMEEELRCNTCISTEKETYKCDICEEKFTVKTGLMEHVMIHIHQSAEQEETGRSVTDNGDNAASTPEAREQPVLRDCVVRLARVAGHEAPLSDMCRGTAGRARLRRATHADDSDVPNDSNTNATTGKETFVCDICNKSFTLKSQLIEHIMNHLHQSKRREASSAVVDSVPAAAGQQAAPLLKGQVRTHSEAKLYSCGICTMNFMQIGHLKTHEHTHKDEKAYSCGICNKKFTRSTNLKLHQRTHTGENLYSCKTCERKFTRISNLKVHERTHTGDKPYSCGTCKKKFTYPTSLRLHRRTHTRESIYSCGICEKNFTQISDLKRHLRTHTGDKPYSCGICKKKFTQISNLKMHERTHTGEKPYSCGICKKKFRQSSSLKEHQNIHTGEKTYSCGICKKKFTHSGSLTNHQNIHTGVKPYSCGICKKKFTHSNSLKAHSKTHTGEKPYSCGICKKKFAHSSSFKSHSITHTGEKPYSCGICKKKFKCSNYLKKHERTHTCGRKLTDLTCVKRD